MKVSSAVDSVKFHFFSDPLSRLSGCAYSAISLLTGENPEVLRRRYGNEAGMPPKVMIKHLKNLKFKIKKLDKIDLYKLLYQDKAVTDAHVILASIRITKKEASWVVLYGGYMWHNFFPQSTTYVTSLTHPPEHIYMLYLPEWKRCAIEPVLDNRLLRLQKLKTKIL